MIPPVDFLTALQIPPNIETEEDLKELSTWLEGVVQQINELFFDHGFAINQLIVGNLPYAQFTVQVTPPLTPQAGWIAYADGVGWDPGSGEGLYVYKADAAWHFIA